MSAIEVTTQAQLDKALKARKPGDWIVCLGGTWYKPLRADGNASVEADGNASVRADGNASVEAGPVVPVQKYPTFRGKINGGVVIEVPDLTKLSPAAWLAHCGVKVARGQAVLFKAVDDDFATSRSRAAGIFYSPGVKVEAPDWSPEPCCGFGLHACAKPWVSERYNRSTARYVQVRVKVADLVVIQDGDGDKVKTPRLVVVCECDLDGEPISTPEAVTSEAVSPTEGTGR